MKFTEYDLKARTVPAILCAVPLLILIHFFVTPAILGMLTTIAESTFLGDIPLATVLIYFFAQINRTISKEVFQKRYFRDELYMPTTNFLLLSDTHYSNEYKQQIRGKILKDFGITLLSKEQEGQDETAARKRIVEAISLVRGKVKDGRLLLQHNIEYGFARNLIGGSVIAFPAALIGAILFYFFSYMLFPFALLITSAVIYLSMIFFSKKIMDAFGIAYAKVLIQEYMGLSQ